MQSFWRSLVDNLTPPTVVAAAAIEGQDFPSIPVDDEDTAPHFSVLSNVQEKLEQLNPQIAAVAAKLSTAALQFGKTAREVVRDVNKELTSTWQPDILFDPDAPAFREHPLRLLPWDDPLDQWPQLRGVFSELQVIRAVQDIICTVTKESDFLSLPPPPGYAFVLDKPRQRFAMEVLKIDRHLCHVRFQVVPKKFQEEEFWLIYVWKLERLIETFPNGFLERLHAVKEEDARAEEKTRHCNQRVAEFLAETKESGTAPVPIIPEFLQSIRLDKIIGFQTELQEREEEEEDPSLSLDGTASPNMGETEPWAIQSMPAEVDEGETVDELDEFEQQLLKSAL